MSFTDEDGNPELPEVLRPSSQSRPIEEGIHSERGVGMIIYEPMSQPEFGKVTCGRCWTALATERVTTVHLHARSDVQMLCKQCVTALHGYK